MKIVYHLFLKIKEVMVANPKTFVAWLDTKLKLFLFASRTLAI